MVALVVRLFLSNRDGLEDTDESGPSLITLPALELLPAVETRKPIPLVARTSEETGLEWLETPSGVPLGVDDALSTLAFRKPDLGVMLEFKKALTGVATTSFEWLLSSRPSTRLPFQRAEEPLRAGDPSTLPILSLVPDHLGDCAVGLATGLRLAMPLVCFS